MTPDPLTVLLRGAIDYAGMFPPATLSVREAADAYARYRAGRHAWMLGSFVISSAKLGEFAPRSATPGHVEGWPVSVVMAGDSAADIERATEVAQRWENASLAAVECPPVAAWRIRDLAALVPDGVEAFFEARVGPDLEQTLDAIAACHALAKIRTGGVTADAFPASPAIYRFLRSCAERRIPCKATAGLHHALRGDYPLTYDAGSSIAPMYGFLNVCVLAALVHAGASEREALDVLTEQSARAFEFREDALVWRDRTISATNLAEMRYILFRSFGSCSFEEPVRDLERLCRV